MVLRERKLIFFHIPKVAGFSIEKFLYPVEMDYRIFHENVVYGLHNGKMAQHLDYEGLLPYVGQEFMDEAFKFAFVRNPWDRLHSAFSYLKPHYIKSFGSFEGFVKNACEQVVKGKYGPTAHIKPQYDYLVDKNGKSVLNYIGKYESLAESFDILKGMIGIEGKLPHLNRSGLKSETYQEAYTPETIALVANAYKKEIDYLGYKFMGDQYLLPESKI